MASKKGKTRSEALQAMREGAPETGEPVDVPETKKQKAARVKKEKAQAKKDKAAAKKQEKADKLAAEKQKRADAKAAEKLKREEAKAAKKVEREAAKAERARVKAEKEANRPPKTGLLTIEQFKSIGGESLAPIAEPSDEEKTKMAAAIDERMRLFNRKIKQATFDLLAVMKWNLWDRMINPETGQADYKSADDWAKSALPLGRTNNYKLLKHVAALGPHMSGEDLAETSTRNRQLLVDNPSIDLKDPEIVKAAKGSHGGLKKAVQKKHPNLHIETSVPIMVPESVKSKHMEAIEAITALHELDTREEAEEALAEYFMQGQTENPLYAGMNNRDAYEAFKQGQNAEALADVIAQPFEGEEEEPQSDEVPTEA